MASGFTTATRNSVLNSLFKKALATVYGALCDGNPGDAGDMVGQEIALAFAYGRTEIVFTDAAAAGTISNTAACEFPVANGGTWGLISHLAICAAAVEGVDDAKASGSLTASKQIDDGDQLKFAIGAIDVSIAVQA